MNFRIGWHVAERARIVHDMNLYRKFLDSLESRVEEALQDWQQDIDKEAERIEDEEYRAAFYEFHSEEYYDIQHYKVILMNSFFTSCFALFEYHLVRICEGVQQRTQSPFSINDLKPRSITERAKVYLTKLGIAFPSDSPEWSEIARYQQIRNKIMHAGGSIEPAGKEAEYIKSKGLEPSWRIDGKPHFAQLELTRPFCEEALDHFNRFLLKLHTACKQGTNKPLES